MVGSGNLLDHAILFIIIKMGKQEDTTLQLVQTHTEQQHDDDDDDDDLDTDEDVQELGVEKWKKHYSSCHRILLVGEGDFSFSLSLARAFGTAHNLVATSLDSQGRFHQ